MSTQDATDIPFGVSHHQQSFKLLELPSELLAMMESENPPTLFLKSATPVESAGPGYALLCSPNKTYRIQQKNSSNPIMVLKPSSTSVSQGEEAIPRPSLCSIATIEDTLELLPQEEETVAVSTKANKWHEKFAKTRVPNKTKD